MSNNAKICLTDRAWANFERNLNNAVARANVSMTVLEFCKNIGIDESVLSRWRTRENTRFPTMEHAVKIERLTGISRRKIRADINWHCIDTNKVQPEV